MNTDENQFSIIRGVTKRRSPVNRLFERTRIATWVIAVAGLFSLTDSINAENFLGITSVSNRLVVATNEAIIIDRFLGYRGNPMFIHNGMTNTTEARDNHYYQYPHALVGPCELVFTNQAFPVFVQFRRMPQGSFQSAIVPFFSNTEASVTLEIPAGKTLRFFSPIFGVFMSADFTRGTQSVSNLTLEGGEQLDGPMTVTLRNLAIPVLADKGAVSVVTYYFTEGAFPLPEGAGIVGPTGGFDLTVEKSTNLSLWTPLIVQPASEDTKAFFRLRVTR